jgi:hypothetical protein
VRAEHDATVDVDRARLDRTLRGVSPQLAAVRRGERMQTPSRVPRYTAPSTTSGADDTGPAVRARHSSSPLDTVERHERAVGDRLEDLLPTGPVRELDLGARVEGPGRGVERRDDPGAPA